MANFARSLDDFRLGENKMKSVRFRQIRNSRHAVSGLRADVRCHTVDFDQHRAGNVFGHELQFAQRDVGSRYASRLPKAFGS